MDIQLFLEILQRESTTGKENDLALFLAERLRTPYNTVKILPVGDGSSNLLFEWGKPQIMFCTHMDTVPPYIAPILKEDRVEGRGSCDAKGQIMALYAACLELEKQGKSNFGLLLLAGEETGSWGAKHFRDHYEGCKYLVVGEPTDNKQASAAKGTKSFHFCFEGRSCHSGYPEHGVSAVELFVDFQEALRKVEFEVDATLGSTTWNIGNLVSNNAKNVLSSKLECDMFFRTTFVTDTKVAEVINNIIQSNSKLKNAVKVTAFGGDTPSYFTTLEGIESAPVAFGSDAPQLTNFEQKILCGPGSILVAHTANEYVLLHDIETATQQYIKMYDTLIKD